MSDAAVNNSLFVRVVFAFSQVNSETDVDILLTVRLPYGDT